MSKGHQKRRKKRKSALASFILDFGIYKGKRLDQVPLDYIRWMADSCEDVSAKWIAGEWLSMLKEHETKPKIHP